MATPTFKGDKLVGRSNYIEWLNNATLFLEINGYMPYIDGSELGPNLALYYDSSNRPFSPELVVRYIDKEAEFQRNSKKALGAIKSIISIDNIERFKDKTSAKALFEAIKSTYGDSNLEIISRYLFRTIDCNYSSFNNIDEYTSQIQSSSLYLKELGYELPRPFIACLLFKGLPSSFDSFASRKYEELAKDIANIDVNKLISELISEEGRMTSNIDLEANKASRDNKPTCTFCKNRGHIEAKCFKKHPELRPSSNSNSNSNFKKC
jgi:rubrerythrin